MVVPSQRRCVGAAHDGRGQEEGLGTLEETGSLFGKWIQVSFSHSPQGYVVVRQVLYWGGGGVITFTTGLCGGKADSVLEGG